jgi:serine/threonine protein kinase
MGLTSGTKLGPYEIQSPLGAGGMGEVYRARDTRLDRAVAVKILPSHLSVSHDTRLQWFDMSGNPTGTTGQVAYYLSPKIAPDGKQVGACGHPMENTLPMA